MRKHMFNIGDIVSVCHPMYGYKCVGTIISKLEFHNTHSKDFEIMIEGAFFIFSQTSIWKLNDTNIKRFPTDVELDMRNFYGIEPDLTPFSKEDFLNSSKRNLKVKWQ